jgi:hypothetical protein
MTRYRSIVACVLIGVVLLAPLLTLAGALPPLASGTFPSGTFLVPMDSKQADRVHVYGFIHEFLRLTPGSGLARIIEPPDVTIQTALTPSGALYQGGPFLIDPKFASAVSSLLSTTVFSSVTVTKLTAPFTSSNIFFVTEPTTILVIYGVFGRTDLTLSRMGINYTLIGADTVLNNPSIINQYSLIVVDCPGFYGNPSSYNPDRRAKIQTVYNTISTHVQSGNEVVFTDIALLDMNATFPGYVNVAPGGAGSWAATVYNPPKGGFQPEFPSQYYNAGPDPNNIKLFTEGGGRVVSSIQPAHASDVRILFDSDKFGVPFRHAILGFYFQFGNGIVEGLALHPYEQTFPNYADQNGYYATYEIYGNKFVHGPQNDFLLSPSPTSATVGQGQSATYTISVTSIGSFSSPVSLQVSGTPFNSAGSFSPPLVTPPAGGSTSSLLSVSTAANTPVGTYNLTVVGSSTLPSLMRQTTVTLTVVAPVIVNDFALSVNPAAPTPRIVQPGECGNYSISVQSIGSFMSPVNLTLSSVPAQISGHFRLRFIPNPVTPPSPGAAVFSTLEACAATDAAPGNYSMTVIGTGGGMTHSVDVALQIPTRPTVPVNWLVYLIILLGLLLGLGLGLLAAYLSRKGVIGKKARFQYVLPLPTIKCRNCGRLMPLAAVYCPYCGRPQVLMVRKPPRVRAAAFMPRMTGRRVIAFVLSLVSGILVLLNSAALLSPSFYSFWSSLFFWLPILGRTYAFTLGFVIGLTLIMGSIIMILRSGALADVIIFPFAVFSLIVGGGFIAGMVLGIVGGILAVLNR